MENLVTRNATAADLDEIMRVEREAWPPEMQASREKFENRLKLFPQGFYVVLQDNKVVGVTTSEIITYDPRNPPKSWDEVTDNGWITKTHNPKGNALYVVSVGASLQGAGVGSELIKAQKALTYRLNLDCLVLGARCPEYSKHQDIPIDKYVHTKRADKQPLDKEIRFYERNGLSVVAPMPEYMGKGGDPESADYGVIMSWRSLTK